ncbi:MAG TPA: SRPBCC domain-containing protein, partial [Flavobacteriales bacterium]|nr:SRPBCC domain-containing protein [Flavobacteriales bacterium]
MNTPNYTTSFIVQRTVREVHDAICRVTAWWTINTDGNTNAVGDEFTVQFADVHRTKQRITEMVPGQRIVWHVSESHLPWLKDAEEWKGTDIIFDIAAEGAGARLAVTHVGLTPQVECFAQCEKGWNFFIDESLLK